MLNILKKFIFVNSIYNCIFLKYNSLQIALLIYKSIIDLLFKKKILLKKFNLSYHRNSHIILNFYEKHYNKKLLSFFYGIFCN